MPEQRLPRKLAAILYADVAGYSRLTGEDEDATHRRLSEYLDLISENVERYRGRVMHYAGDALLAMFDAVVDALICAVRIQQDLKTRNVDLPEERKIKFRIGINLGDVIEDRGDIYGDGVNVAARLEGLAEPGAVCISGTVRDAIGNKLPLDYAFLGKQQVKNIAEPVRAYCVNLRRGAELPSFGMPKKSSAGRLRRFSTVSAAVLLVVLVVVLVWLEPWRQDAEQKVRGTARDEASIVVLPFRNMSDDPGMEYFSDGITEDLIMSLARMPELDVVARNTSFTYKDKSVSVQTIGDEVGARFVLEGSVRNSGDVVRITAQLIDTDTGRHVWAERFDKEGENVFALQDEVTGQISRSIGSRTGKVKQALEQRAWSKDSASLEEYDYYLRGHALFFRFTEEAMLEARAIWSEGLSKYPDSGLLRVKIGWTYYQAVADEWADHPRQNYQQAITLAEEGLNDPELPVMGRWYGHWLMAVLQAEHEKNFARAIEEVNLTLEVAPNDPDTLTHLSSVYLWAGRVDDAARLQDKAIVLQVDFPSWFYRYHGWTDYAKGDCESALEKLGKISWFSTQDSLFRAACYARLNMAEEAREEVAKLREFNPTVSLSSLAELLPYKNEADLEGLLSDLELAGLPR